VGIRLANTLANRILLRRTEFSLMLIDCKVNRTVGLIYPW